MKKSLWQWIRSFFVKLNPVFQVVKPNPERNKENQQTIIRRWWR